jgi:hypothetical protein
MVPEDAGEYRTPGRSVGESGMKILSWLKRDNNWLFVAAIIGIIALGVMVRVK